jgi:hypothetical protein
MLEFDMGGAIGRSGHITMADMVDPKKLFANEYKKILEIKKMAAKDPKYRANIKKIFGETEAYKVWSNYYNAMMSKTGKKAIKFFTWLNFVCGGKMGQKIMAYTVDGSYLFGYWILNHFVAAYFAPVGYTGMAKLLKGICQYDNIIFAVTQDLSPMLERLGVPKSSETREVPWRSKKVTKDVFGTSQRAIKTGLKILSVASKLKR